jgi:glyoxylase-like metal-dependent hydrolase (beta-lactamase superfamily II)
MRYAVIGSGSCGNSYIFKTKNSGFVVDNGYSFSEFRRRAEAFGFNIKDIKFIFLTHVHGDHLRGVEALSNKLEIPVFTAENLDVSQWVTKGFFKQVGIIPGQDYCLDDFSFTVFPTFHDAPNSVG